MKLYAICAVLLLLMPFASADLIVDEVNAFLDDERITSVDKDGGTIEVVPGDILDIVVDLRNDKNETIEAMLRGNLEDIDDGNDVVKEQEWYVIVSGDSRAKTLSYRIPSDARDDSYDFEVEVSYRYGNGTSGTVETIDYRVKVDAKTSIESQIDVASLLSNLTNSCESISDTAAECFDNLALLGTCQDELSTVKEQRGGFEQQKNSCEESKTAALQDKTTCEAEKNTLNSQMVNMLTIQQCNNQTASAVNKERNSSGGGSQNMLLIGGGIALAYWYTQKRKKAKESATTDFEYQHFK